MSAIDQLFKELRAAGRKAFMPFITAGDPDLDFTAMALNELSRHGATLCEVGFPYSDPIADGPVIQASYTRALAKKVHVDDILEAVRSVRPNIKMPLVAMVSYAIVYRIGPAAFVDKAITAGFAGAIVPDLLVEESADLAAICRKADFSLVQLVTPTTPRDRAVRIAEQSSGFLYYVSVTGITGERRELPANLVENLEWLRSRTNLPICVGFGISRPDHVRLLAPVADGLIVGSALVRPIADSATKPRSQILSEITTLVDELVAAMPMPST